MSKLKPIGSEKLSGSDKIKRIMEIARYNETIPNSINETSKSEYSVNLSDSNNYQIIKERQGYVIKKTISESETEYIEPMKNRKYYSSYSQAFKRLNLLAKELNRLNENEEGTSLFGEQKKFVLKTPKPAEPQAETPPPPAAPPAVPSPDLPPSPLAAPDAGSESTPAPDLGMGTDEMTPPAPGGEEMGLEMDTELSPDSDEEVTFKTIQKLTGKLTQKIRTLDNDKGMTSEDIKYVINMVLSAFDLSKVSEEDKEDIMSKFEETETEEMPDMGSELSPEEDITSDTEVGDIQANMDLPVAPEVGESYGSSIMDSMFGESKVDKVISKYFERTKKEILENQKRNVSKKILRESQIKKQMVEVLKLAETVEQEMATKKILQENTSANFVGKTNKKNLIVESKGRQIKISPRGLVI